MRLTNEELDAIRERAEKATAGPWFHSEGSYVVSDVQGDSVEWYADFIAETERDNDAEFIASARSDVPKLLAEIESLKAERAYWRMEHEHQRKQAEMYREKYLDRQAEVERLETALLLVMDRGLFYANTTVEHHAGAEGMYRAAEEALRNARP